MKPPAEAFIREYFHVTMFWGEHLHVLYTPNEKRKKEKKEEKKAANLWL